MKQLDPRAVWLFFVSSFLRLFFLFLLLGGWLFGLLSKSGADLSISRYIGYVVAAILVLIVLIYIWARLSYKYYRYELKDDGFHKESGVITKKYVTIPYDRIQNIDIYRGLWSRILGLSDLQIQTAGASAQVSRSGVSGAGSEGRLPGLSFADAEQLRDELIRRAKQSKNQGL